ncbi:hypothetical protein [Poriferisphaera sp. WC338]|uniref:hypothetical protein n=1 Tax=Poriferisphaera sp. WC338 TaxID=3425129 RepID=UPI003D81B3BF
MAMLAAGLMATGCMLMGQSQFAKDVQGTPAKERAVEQTQKMTAVLGLTRSQKISVGQINMDAARQVRVIVEEKRGWSQTNKSLDSVFEMKQKRLKAVLANEQFEKYMQMREELGDDG